MCCAVQNTIVKDTFFLWFQLLLQAMAYYWFNYLTVYLSCSADVNSNYYYCNQTDQLVDYSLSTLWNIPWKLLL